MLHGLKDRAEEWEARNHCYRARVWTKCYCLMLEVNYLNNVTYESTFFALRSFPWHVASACDTRVDHILFIIQETLSFFGNLHNIKLTWAWRPTTAITTGNGLRQARPCYLDWRIAHKWEAWDEIAHMEVLTSCSRHDRSFCTLVLSSFLHMWAWISTQSLVCTDRAEG